MYKIGDVMTVSLEKLNEVISEVEQLTEEEIIQLAEFVNTKTSESDKQKMVGVLEQMEKAIEAEL
jgi:hypothetical protein